MNVSNEQHVAEETVARALRAMRANDAEAAPKRHSRQTNQCPNIARFAAVLRKSGPTAETWTAAEAGHVRGCAFCQSLFRLFAAASEAAQAASSGELTVSGLDTSEETQTGFAPPGTKKSGSAPMPATRRTAE